VFVPTTVYVVVVVGEASTEVPVVAERAVAGDHTYVSAPPAVNVTVPVLQYPPAEPEAVTVGLAPTVTFTVAVAVAPQASVTITVYVVAAVGVTTNELPACGGVKPTPSPNS
jgi:hypothetical protein